METKETEETKKSASSKAPRRKKRNQPKKVKGSARKLEESKVPEKTLEELEAERQAHEELEAHQATNDKKLYYCNIAALLTVGLFMAFGCKEVFQRNPSPVEQRFQKLFMVTLLWIFAGVQYFVMQKHYNFLTALYYIVEIVTTVGYGDLTVVNDGEKIFMSFYVLVGIVVISEMIGILTDLAVEKANDSLHEKLGADVDHDADHAEFDNPLEKPENKKLAELESLTPFYKATAWLVLMIAFGTVFYGNTCSCGYGVSAIEGCHPLKCEETGGVSRSYVDAFYMSCITLTTVGFGDFTPTTAIGRLIAIFWMISGIIVVGNFVGCLTDLSNELNKEPPPFVDIAESDLDCSGVITKQEFLRFMLVQTGAVKQATIDKLDAQFDKMDAKSETPNSGNVKVQVARRFQKQMMGNNSKKA